MAGDYSCWKCQGPVGYGGVCKKYPRCNGTQDVGQTAEPSAECEPVQGILKCPYCNSSSGLHLPTCPQRPVKAPTIDEMAGMLSPELGASLNYVHHDPNARSILVIDLGEQCVVRVELGIFNDVWKLFCRSGHEHESTLMINEPFAAVRDAIDSQDKPLPRIERCNTTEPSYEIFTEQGAAGVIYQWAFDALSELAGKPLPIWTGSGTWKQIGDANVTWCPVAIWRYTR